MECILKKKFYLMNKLCHLICCINKKDKNKQHLMSAAYFHGIFLTINVFTNSEACVFRDHYSILVLNYPCQGNE